jgi:aspartyl/glutamyl-tRNA(Asn/Gln) amidotransferase C subunit
MIEIETLKKYANNLMFDMNDEEYITLQKEFEVILKQMDKISEIDKIEEVEPMFHPFPVPLELTEYESENLSTDLALQNAKEVKNNKVVVPKVVA